MCDSVLSIQYNIDLLGAAAPFIMFWIRRNQNEKLKWYLIRYTKVYDHVNWSFLTQFTSQIGFHIRTWFKCDDIYYTKWLSDQNDTIDEVSTTRVVMESITSCHCYTLDSILNAWVANLWGNVGSCSTIKKTISSLLHS